MVCDRMHTPEAHVHELTAQLSCCPGRPRSWRGEGRSPHHGARDTPYAHPIGGAQERAGGVAVFFTVYARALTVRGSLSSTEHAARIIASQGRTM